MFDEDKKKKEYMKNTVIKVDVLTNFIKSEAESFSDADVYTDDDDSEEDGSLDFAKIRAWLAREYSVSVKFVRLPFMK